NRDARGLDGWRNDVADWLDKRIEFARQWWQPNPDAINWNTGVNFISSYAFGTADLFRVGSGFGHAIYDRDENCYGRAADVLQDVVRASAIFEILGGAGAGVVGNSSIAADSAAVRWGPLNGPGPLGADVAATFRG